MLKISVVTPCFNASQFLEESIQSVVDQKYPNLEYIIIDGGSTDGSQEIIKKYESFISFWNSESDNGLYDALNKGFQKSNGEVMGWINAGDLLMPNSLYLLNDLFQKHQDVVWIQGQPLLLSDQGYVMHNSPHFGIENEYLLKRYHQGYHFIQQESTYWRRSIWEKSGGQLSSHLKLAGDFELWMRFFQHTHLYHTKGLIGAFRVHDGQLSSNSDLYFEECDQVVDHWLNKHEKKEQIRKYKFWKVFERIPLIRRLLWNRMKRTTKRSYTLSFIK